MTAAIRQGTNLHSLVSVHTPLVTSDLQILARADTDIMPCVMNEWFFGINIARAMVAEISNHFCRLPHRATADCNHTEFCRFKVSMGHNANFKIYPFL